MGVLVAAPVCVWGGEFGGPTSGSVHVYLWIYDEGHGMKDYCRCALGHARVKYNYDSVSYIPTWCRFVLCRRLGASMLTLTKPFLWCICRLRWVPLYGGISQVAGSSRVR